MNGRERVCPQCGARYGSRAAFCQVDGAALGQDDDPFLGATFDGRYRIETRLGEGGMGVVYRATDLERERQVALKVLHPQLSVQPEAKRRFRREARLALELRHPNLVRVLDFGATGEGTPYLVMELLEGETLAARLQPGEQLTVDEALELLGPICRAVEAAHARSIVHRDLKPENVFLARPSRGTESPRGAEVVKVLDFGVARVLDDDETIATRTGLIFGTARYISPEGARGEPTDARSDVYSLAVLTYQLLSGRLPFESAQPMNLLVAHAREAPPELLSHSSASGIPKALARAVMDALDKRPGRRPETAGAYLRSLEEALAPRRRAMSAVRARVWVALAFVVGFFVVAATGFAFKTLEREGTREEVAELLQLAKSAEAQGRVDGPGGVLALTEAILALSPAQVEARRMRERALATPSAAPVERPARGALATAEESPRAGRALRVDVTLDRPAPGRRVVVAVEGDDEVRELPVTLDDDGLRGHATYRPGGRGERELRLLIDGEEAGEPLRFELEAPPTRRPPPAPASVTTLVAPQPAPAPTTMDSGGIDWSPPP